MALGAALIRRKLTDNLKGVRREIEAACQRSLRDPRGITLVAVTKQVEPEVIRVALELGLADLGENRAQQLASRAAAMQDIRKSSANAEPAQQAAPPAPRWHMIGHLQRNKVKLCLPHACLIHSVDSVRLAEEIHNQSKDAKRRTDALLEVNVSGERSKYGVPVGAVNTLLERFKTLPALRIRGFMTMAPLNARPAEVRGYFVRLRELFDEVRSGPLADNCLDTLSMGMSNDYQIAIECGATLVRIGSALFDGLASKRAVAAEED